MTPQRTRRRKKNRTNRTLLGLISVLVLLLAVAIVVAVGLPGAAPQPNPTNPPTDPPTDAPTDAPTEPPTEPPTDPPLNGWQTVGSQRYYYIDGTPLTGWQNLDGQNYYFREDGTMARGTVVIDGKNHFFSSQGIPFIVANPWNYIPEDYVLDLVTLPKEYGEGQIQRECYDALIQMIQDCNAAMRAQNIYTEAFMVSGYRSHERQTNNFNNKINTLMQQNPGMSREEATRLAATVIAVPGTSEHELGLAADIIDTQLWALEEEQANLPAQKWLMENCWKYGFLLRYPANSTDSTGIIYEPWHYRYFGKDIAEEIHFSGMTVEEYLVSISS